MIKEPKEREFYKIATRFRSFYLIEKFYEHSIIKFWVLVNTDIYVNLNQSISIKYPQTNNLTVFVNELNLSYYTFRILSLLI